MVIVGFFIILLAFMPKGKKRIREENSLIKKFFKVFYIILFKILKPRKEKTKKQLEHKLKFIPRKMDIYDFYKLKVLFVLVFALVSLAIYLTNFYYYKQDILFSSAAINTLDLTNFDEVEYLHDKQDEGANFFGEKELEYYNYIVKNYPRVKSIKNISDSNKESIVEEVETILLKGFPDERVHGASALRLVNKIQLIQNYTYSLFYFIWLLVGYFLPNILVSIYLKFKRAAYAQDISKIKLATYLLGTMDTTIKDLLISLQKVSKTYEGVFIECVNNFNSVYITREEAIMLMTKRVDNVQFRKLCAILKEGIKTSKDNAISILEQDIRLEDKEEMMLSEDKIEKRTWIAILLMAVCMLCMAMLLIMPFTVIFTGSGI